MLTAIRQWVIRTMMKSKGQTGVVQTLPKRDLIELNTQITAQRLMQGGIDPQSLKNADQVENAIIAIESRPKVQEGIRSTSKAKVFDLEGKEIKDPKNIMGGKEINQQTLNEELMKTENPYSDLVNTPRPKTIKEREAEVLAGMEKNNKEAVARIRNRKLIEEAIDNVSPGFVKGDNKYNAEIVAEEIANKRGLDYYDMDTKQRADIYGEAFDALMKMRDDLAQGGRAGFDNGGAPSIKLFPRASGRQVEQEVGPGIKISERDLNYGITGLLQGDKFFGGAEIDKGKVKIDVLSPEGDTLFKDTISKPDAVNFILGMGDSKGDKFQIKTDKDFENMQLVLKKSFAEGGRAGYRFGIGPLLKRLSQKSPKKAYTDYLESVKKRAQEGDMKSLVPELSAVAATGIFINRRMKDVLENMKEKDMENNLQNFRKELESDPFYQKYPDIKDKVLENYTEKMFGEKRADGGRIGFKDGMSRRTFLKLLGGMAAIPIVGKFLKPIKTAKGVKAVPIIKTDDVPGKPEWFDALVNKVITEGDDVTKKLATVEREIVHTKKINDTDQVTVYQDLNTDSVRVEYKSPKNMLEEPVDLEYKRTPPDEGSPKASSEFEVTESGFVGRADGPDDFFIDAEPVGGRSIKDLDSDVSALKEYATGKKLTLKEFVESKKRKDKVKRINEGDLDERSQYITDRQGDYDPLASGGIARMLGE